jgi:peptidoglycan/LPS O-acetylase OafA/YrhL
LDGVRAAAALFVVFHHSWLTVWPSFPRNIGPWWVAPLVYGHLAVAVFIVVSGFSLALAPARNGGSLKGGTRHFIRRRAWRILPTYWAALIISTLITALIIVPHLSSGTTVKGFVVHGLLLQDVVGSFAPNGAFWSIAVEWQIYFLFPLILLLGRRTRPGIAVLITVLVVIVAEEVAGLGSPLNKIYHLSPQFLALFALGVLAVYAGRAESAVKWRRHVGGAGVAAIVAFVVLAMLEGSTWIVDRYFWIDLLVGAGVACIMTSMFAGGFPWLRRLFAARVCVFVGLFSYSIYLLHDPLVVLLGQDVFGPMHLSRVVTFVLMIGVGVPAIVAVCYGFHLMFEAPFLRCRGVEALRLIPFVGSVLPNRTRTADSSPGPAPVTPEVVTVPNRL